MPVILDSVLQILIGGGRPCPHQCTGIVEGHSFYMRRFPQQDKIECWLDNIPYRFCIQTYVAQGSGFALGAQGFVAALQRDAAEFFLLSQGVLVDLMGGDKFPPSWSDLFFLIMILVFVNDRVELRVWVAPVFEDGAQAHRSTHSVDRIFFFSLVHQKIIG